MYTISHMHDLDNTYMVGVSHLLVKEVKPHTSEYLYSFIEVESRHITDFHRYYMQVCLLVYICGSSKCNAKYDCIGLQIAD